MLLGIDVGGIIYGCRYYRWGYHRFIGEAANHEGESHEWHNGCLRCGDAWCGPCTNRTGNAIHYGSDNTIVEHKEQPVDLYVVAGPGRNVDDIFPVRPVYLKGIRTIVVSWWNVQM